MRSAPVLSFALLTSALLAASSCVEGIGGEGQACSTDGKCGVGLVCQANVCRANSAGLGGSVQGSGGAATGGSDPSGGAGSGGKNSSTGGSKASGGGENAGGESSGGSDSETGGNESTGGSEGVGGSQGDGGSSSGGGPSGTNLLQNGDFSSGDMHWKCDCGSATQKGEKDGSYCIEGSGDVGIALSAPGEGEDPFPLESGQTYTLFYRVKGSGSWEAKIGLADPPYDAFGSWNDSVNGMDTFKTISHEFTVDSGSDRVGFIFQGTVKGSACFDDVFIGVNTAQ